MSRTYRATGINLKGMPLGEADRLLTILTREFGLIRAVATGARKHNSSLSGRSGLFVVNQLLISKGRSLDRITQAETLESYPGLSQNLKKLTASQYLAELVLSQALSEQPQEELFCLLSEHLERLEQAASEQVLPLLTHAIFHLLALAGLAPQVQFCGFSQRAITPDLSNPNWWAEFDVTAGGLVEGTDRDSISIAASVPRPILKEQAPEYKLSVPRQRHLGFKVKLSAIEVSLLQHLPESDLRLPDDVTCVLGTSELSCQQLTRSWLSIERVLRQYAQSQFEHPIRSATLIDTCFPPVPSATTLS